MTTNKFFATKMLIIGFSLFINNSVLVAEEQLIQLESAQILGNQEQPGILYIVPWGQPKRSDFLSQSITPIVNVDGVLKPVDPQTISREFNYYKKVQLLSRSESH